MPVGGSYCENALYAECERVAAARQGKRNDTLNRAAFALGQLVGAGALDPSETVDALLGAAARCGLGEREARNTVASGVRAGLAYPRQVVL